MQEEIINLYEKISDQLSEEEFQAQIDEILMENDLYDEVDAAHIILEKYGVDDESSDESGDEAGVEMSAEILEYYNKVKDKISPEDFLNRMDYYKSKYKLKNTVIQEISYDEWFRKSRPTAKELEEQRNFKFKINKRRKKMSETKRSERENK